MSVFVRNYMQSEALITELNAKIASLQKEVDACHALDCFSLGQENEKLGP